MKPLYAGDTLEFGLDVPQYPPADGWTLKIRLVPRFTSPAQSPVTLTASANVAIAGVAFDYGIAVQPSITADWVAGAYGWHSWVEKDGARQVLEGTQYAGEVTVLPDPATMVAGTDTRSRARKALDDALAALAAWTPTYREHTIGDRTVKFNAHADVRAAVRFWEERVAREEGRTTGPLGRIHFGVPN
jgi:hypothetical protein